MNDEVRKDLEGPPIEKVVKKLRGRKQTKCAAAFVAVQEAHEV